MKKQAYQIPEVAVTEAQSLVTYLQTPSAPNEGITYGGEDDDPDNPDDPTAKEREDDTTWGNLW